MGSSGQTGPTQLTVSVEPLESSDAQSLIRALDGYLSNLYPPEDNFTHVATEELRGERGAFLVARDDGVAVGCGAIRRLSPSTAEVKRMFVVPGNRGRGVGKAILDELVSWAAAAGVSTVVLETGERQEEAVRLYERFGFSPIPCFGAYADSAQSVCYEKAIDSNAT